MTNKKEKYHKDHLLEAKLPPDPPAFKCACLPVFLYVWPSVPWVENFFVYLHNAQLEILFSPSFSSFFILSPPLLAPVLSQQLFSRATKEE